MRSKASFRPTMCLIHTAMRQRGAARRGATRAAAGRRRGNEAWRTRWRKVTGVQVSTSSDTTAKPAPGHVLDNEAAQGLDSLVAAFAHHYRPPCKHTRTRAAPPPLLVAQGAQAQLQNPGPQC